MLNITNKQRHFDNLCIAYKTYQSYVVHQKYIKKK